MRRKREVQWETQTKERWAQKRSRAQAGTGSETKTLVLAGHLVRLKPSRQRENNGGDGSLLCPAGPDSLGRGRLKPHLGTQTAVPRPPLPHFAGCSGQAPGERAVRAAGARVVGGARPGWRMGSRR